MSLVSSCSWLCPIHWSHVLSREWRCSWSSADRRSPNYTWLINNCIAWQCRYIRGFTLCSGTRFLHNSVLQTLILDLGWGLLNQFPPFRYFPNFQNRQNTCQLLNITFIFGRCRRSSAAVTSVKYECGWNNLTCTFARSKILLKEKLTNGALVTPTPNFHIFPVAGYKPSLYTRDISIPIFSICLINVVQNSFKFANLIFSFAVHAHNVIINMSPVWTRRSSWILRDDILKRALLLSSW